MSPDALTAWGVLVAAAVAAVAAAGGRWPLVAVGIVVVAGLLDNLDGAVAIALRPDHPLGLRAGLARRPVVRRGLPAARCGSSARPARSAWPAASLMVLQEYARARAGNAGMGEVGVVTVWERPTRVILTAFLLLGCGLLPGHADLIATLGAVAWIALGLTGLTQLLLVVHQRLA